MVSIEKRFSELQGNLYKPFVFFIPKSILTKDMLKGFSKEIQEELFDTLLLIKEDGAGYKLNQQPVLYSILQKKSNLDDGILQLFELREQLKPKQVDFFMQRYLKQVDMFVFITGWLYNHLELCAEPTTEEVRSSFESQMHSLKQHQNDLINHCLIVEQPIKKEEAELIQYIQTELSDLKTLFLANKTSRTDSQEQTQNINKVLKKKIKKERPKRITEKQATDYLLETVFNIELK